MINILFVCVVGLMNSCFLFPLCPQQTFDFQSMEIAWAQDNQKSMEMNLFYGSGTQDPVEQDDELMEQENIAGIDY